ncbi:MAG TPA: DUF488 family protein [Chloroflexota bacterium]
MFRHASVYDAYPEVRDGEQPPLRVLITRYWPRGVRGDRVDAWLKDAAPSRDLLRAYRDASLAWDDFEARYRTEILTERPSVLDELRRLEQQHGEVVLLCYERLPPAEHCHRLSLLDLLTHPVRQSG